MKKPLSFAILAILLFTTLFACAAEAETGDVSPQNTFEAAGMPAPFGEDGGIGGSEEGFTLPYINRLYLTEPLGSHIIMYLNLTEDEWGKALAEKNFVYDYWYTVNQISLLETGNIFAHMIKFDLPDDVIIGGIQEHNDMNEKYAMQFNDDDFRSRKFTHAEIEALLSRDAATVLKHFATEYAIVIEDRAYSPAWLYLHTPEDYAKAGITAEMVEEKLDSYGEFNLTAEAAEAFEAKLSGFIGESMTLERK